MNFLKWIEGQYLKPSAARAVERLKSQELIGATDPARFADSLGNPDAYYFPAFQDFHRTVPEESRAHHAHYRIDRRGFGEDAFHGMWRRSVRQYKPSSFLEISASWGQVVSLIGLLAKLEKFYQPASFSTAGHPGPSRLASEIDPIHFEEVLQKGHNR